MPSTIKEFIYFSTFTIDRWIPIFDDYPDCKKSIIDILEHYFNNCGIQVFAFCILRDHIHIIWQIKEYSISEIEHSFKSYSSKLFKKYLLANEPIYLSNFISERKDRAYKFWKLDSKSIQLVHSDIVKQKIEYVHNNPTKGEYTEVNSPEEYEFSSASCYIDKKKNFPFITIYIA